MFRKIAVAVSMAVMATRVSRTTALTNGQVVECRKSCDDIGGQLEIDGGVADFNACYDLCGLGCEDMCDEMAYMYKDVQPGPCIPPKMDVCKAACGYNEAAISFNPVDASDFAKSACIDFCDVSDGSFADDWLRCSALCKQGTAGCYVACATGKWAADSNGVEFELTDDECKAVCDAANGGDDDDTVQRAAHHLSVQFHEYQALCDSGSDAAAAAAQIEWSAAEVAALTY